MSYPLSRPMPGNDPIGWCMPVDFVPPINLCQNLHLSRHSSFSSPFFTIRSAPKHQATHMKDPFEFLLYLQGSFSCWVSLFDKEGYFNPGSNSQFMKRLPQQQHTPSETRPTHHRKCCCQYKFWFQWRSVGHACALGIHQHPSMLMWLPDPFQLPTCTFSSSLFFQVLEMWQEQQSPQRNSAWKRQEDPPLFHGNDCVVLEREDDHVVGPDQDRPQDSGRLSGAAPECCGRYSATARPRRRTDVGGWPGHRRGRRM